MEHILLVIVASFGVYAAILAYTRICGLRSFSKMSASDFAMTVAVGSLFASTAVSPERQLIPGLVALAALFVGQYLIAMARSMSSAFSQVVDNQPLLLMQNGEILDENLRQANVTRADLYAKLREANAYNLNQVLAVVFETTGDISVLHTGQSGSISPEVMQDVLGGDSAYVEV